MGFPGVVPISVTGAAAPSRPRLSNTMNSPTTVLLEIDEGDQRGQMEVVFPTRFQAEWFVYQLPYLMSVGDWTQVKSAIISPLEIL